MRDYVREFFSACAQLEQEYPGVKGSPEMRTIVVSYSHLLGEIADLADKITQRVQQTEKLAREMRP